jgi:hypothetical protein
VQMTAPLLHRLASSALICLMLCGCGWESKAVFVRPEGGSRIEIDQPFPANGWGIRVALVTAAERRTLYQLRGDVFLDFADVFWSPDGQSVALLTCGTPYLRLAYSLKESDFVSFAPFQQPLVSQLRSEYQLGPGMNRDRDVLEWTCSPEGRDAFVRRHPGAVPR